MSALRPIRSLPLSSTHKVKLAQAGYESVEELTSVRASDISKGLVRSWISSSSSAIESRDYLPTRADDTPNACERTSRSPAVENPATKYRVGGPCSALDLLKLEEMQGHVVTFCAKIDEMLGGGVPVGKITEFCGAPGIGKTQIW